MCDWEQDTGACTGKADVAAKISTRKIPYPESQHISSMSEVEIQHSDHIFTILDVILVLKCTFPLWVTSEPIIYVKSGCVGLTFWCFLFNMSVAWMTGNLINSGHTDTDVLHGLCWRQVFGNLKVISIACYPTAYSVGIMGDKSHWNSKVWHWS